MPNYQSILNRMPPNAVGRKRIQAIEKAVDPTSNKNWYVTGATLGGSPNYTLSLARNGGLSDVTVNLSALSDAANPGGSSNDVQYNNAGSFGGITLAKGKILSADGSGVPTALAAGTNTYVLTADSTETTGLKWAAAATGTIGGSIAEDRIAVGASTANTIAGYSTFEWDAATLKMTNTGDTAITLLGDANRSGENSHAMAMRGKWDGTVIGTMMIMTGPDTTNKDDGQLAFYTASAGTQAERMRIDETGNIGIGTSAPAETLSVVGGNILLGTNAKYIQFVNNGGTQFDALGYDGNNDLVLNTPSDIIFKRNGTQNVRIKSNDDFLVDTDNLYVDVSENSVGINTNTPAFNLDVVGTTQLSGAAKLASTLVVGTNATVSGTSDLEGATTIRSTLSMYGAEAWPSFKVTPTSDTATIDFEASGGNASTPLNYPLFTLSNTAQDVDPGGGDPIVYASLPTIHFQKIGPRNAGNTANTTAGFRFLASGLSTAAATATQKQYLVYTYQPDESSGSPSEIAKLDSTGIFTATTFAGELSGTINSATTATTQSSGDNSTKVATTAYADAAAGGGGGTPGGSDTQVQFNDGGSFAGDADMTFDGTNLTLANNLYANKVGAQGDTNNLIDLSSADTQDFNIDSKSFMTFTEVGSSGDTIVFNEGSNNIDFRIESDDNANMFVMDAGQNRIGIGTAAPATKLDVVGTITAGANSYMSMQDNEVTTSSGHLKVHSANDVNLDANSGLTNFQYQGTETFRIAAGASSPVTLQPKASGFDLALAAQDGTSVLHLDSTDKFIGIGTVTPGKLLHIDSDTTGDVEVLRLENSNASTTSLDSVSQGFRMRRDGDDYSFTAAKITAVKENGWTSTASTIDASLTFSTLANESSLTEKMRIDSTGNVGIGTTTPAQKLHVVGDIEINNDWELCGTSSSNFELDNDGTLKYRFANGRFQTTHAGTAAAPTIVDNNDTTTGIYYPGTNDWGVSTNGTAALYIGSTQNVGIGTTSPAQMLDVSGSQKLYGSLNIANGAITSNPGTNHLWASGATLFWGGSQLGTTTPGAGAIEGTATAGEISYGDGSNSITSSSNLQFDGNNMTLASGKYIYFNDADASIHAGADSRLDIKGESITFASGSTEVMRVNGGGLGIGTSAPTQPLDVITGDGVVIRRENTDSSIYGPSLYIDRKKATGGDLSSGDLIGNITFRPFETDYDNRAATISAAIEGTVTTDTTPGRLMFSTAAAGANNVTERMRIDSTGNVGIGTTAPTNLLTVSGNASPFRLYGTSTGKVEFDVSTSGDFTVDADDDIRLDAGGQDIVLQGAGSEFGRLTNSSQDFIIQNTQNDKDMIFKTVDNTVATEMMRIDGSHSRVGIGTSSPDFKLDVRHAGYNVVLASGAGNGNYPILHVIDSTDQWPAWFEGNRSGDPGAGIRLWHNPASAAENNNTYVHFCMNNDGGTRKTYVNLKGGIDDYTAGTEDGKLTVRLLKDGTETEMAKFDATGLTVTGTVSATAKSFNIEHPLYKDKRLVHGSLEGPEHGIYIRGSIESKEYGCLIELPEYWDAMCEDYTVQLTPHGPYTVYIKEKQKDKVMVASTSREYKFDYYIVGSRTDETLEVVQDA